VSDEQASEPGEIQDFPEQSTDLTEKAELEGHVLVMESWKENPSRYTAQIPGQDPPAKTYLVFQAHDECDPQTKKCPEGQFSFAGGSVLDKQAREMNGIFRARLSMPKGKRYWVFRAPTESRSD